MTNDPKNTLLSIVDLIARTHPELAADIARIGSAAALSDPAPAGAAQDAIERNFTKIYDTNHWGSSESVSGEGSTIEYTRNLREKLPDLIAKFGISKIFDAPCGDFNWMRQFLSDHPMAYVGGDVVKPLVDSLRSRFENDTTRFQQIDITRDPFPAADLMMSRDCLIHLSFAQAKLFFENFLRSGIPYVLLSSHVNGGRFVNKDIEPGGFRHIDLFSAPYNLPADVLYQIDDWNPPFLENRMYLWRRDQIATALPRFGP